MVLQILKLGYNVLLSDVDVYWFKNPLPFLSSLGPAVLLAQSDEHNITGTRSKYSTLKTYFSNRTNTPKENKMKRTEK